MSWNVCYSIQGDDKMDKSKRNQGKRTRPPEVSPETEDNVKHVKKEISLWINKYIKLVLYIYHCFISTLILGISFLPILALLLDLFSANRCSLCFLLGQMKLVYIGKQKKVPR